MSRTLKLVDSLLARSEHLHDLGRLDDAKALLTRLAGFRNLAAAAEASAHARLGEICLQREEIARARSHLRAAVKLAPEFAPNHYLLALAWMAGDKNLKQAHIHFSRALKLEADQPECHVEFGLLLIREKQIAKGVRHLHIALELAPDDPEILRDVVKGLRKAKQPGEARSLLLAARFRNPRDQRFRKLWNHFQIDLVRTKQSERSAKSGLVKESSEPIILVFPNQPGKSKAQGGKIIRQDGPSKLPAPRHILSMKRPDQRHAQ
jgi:tetratricopeptide (TPR) repeat protein